MKAVLWFLNSFFFWVFICFIVGYLRFLSWLWFLFLFSFTAALGAERAEFKLITFFFKEVLIVVSVEPVSQQIAYFLNHGLFLFIFLLLLFNFLVDLLVVLADDGDEHIQKKQIEQYHEYQEKDRRELWIPALYQFVIISITCNHYEESMGCLEDWREFLVF